MAAKYSAQFTYERFCAGRGIPPVADIYTAIDRTTLQIIELMNRLGQDLARDEHKWKFLQREFQITTVPSQDSYALPLGFNAPLSDASWNRTTRLPVIGGLQEFEWQALKARLLTGTTFTMLYRINANDAVNVYGNIVFYEAPTSVQTIVIPYVSEAWVYLSPSGVWDVVGINSAGEIIGFDQAMFLEGINHYWNKTKGLDTTSSEKDFEKSKQRAKDNDVAGRTLSLAHNSRYPYLGVLNLPDSGYGS